jgi:hypothetical protein
MERFLEALTNAISGQKKTHPKDLGGGSPLFGSQT